MKGILLGNVIWTDGGSPVDRVDIMGRDGHVHETHVSHTAGIGFGISNPEYRTGIHAFKLTEAGRVLREDLDTTAAARVLVSHFTPESPAHTMTMQVRSRGQHMSYSVHVLAVTGGSITDYSGLVARLLGRRKVKDGGVLMAGGAGDPATNVVQHMSDILWGEGGWVEESKVR